MMSGRQIELFYLGGDEVPVGALVTETLKNKYSLHIKFSTPDGGVVEGDAVVHLADSVRNWTEFTFRGFGAECTGKRDEQGVWVAGERVDRDGPVIPSYAVSALVAEMVRNSDKAVDFWWLNESAASADAVSPARLEPAGDEDLASPLAGPLAGCSRVELTVDGRRTNTYWVHDGAVVASDWGWATSYALPTVAAANLRCALGLDE